GVLAGQQPARLLRLGGHARRPGALRAAARRRARAASPARRAGAAGLLPRRGAGPRARAAAGLRRALGDEARLLLVAEPAGRLPLSRPRLPPLPGLLSGDDGAGAGGGRAPAAPAGDVVARRLLR